MGGESKIFRREAAENRNVHFYSRYPDEVPSFWVPSFWVPNIYRTQLLGTELYPASGYQYLYNVLTNYIQLYYVMITPSWNGWGFVAGV